MVPFDPALGGGSRVPAPVVAPLPEPRLDLAMFAHDIRGALQGVFGGLAAIRVEELPAEVREQLQRIGAASRTLQCLSDGLSALSPGAELVDDDDVLLDEFLGTYRERWAGEARCNRLGFEIATAGDLPAGLRIPQLALLRVLGNLTANSIAYAGRGTVRLEVRRNGDGDLVFQLTDDGPGLSDAALRQLAGNGLQEAIPSGHGLGLHIVRTLAARIGGRISVRNREQGGILATLAFPAALCLETDGHAPVTTVGAGAEAVPDAGNLPTPPRKNLAGLRVLLAEDNPTNQMVASQMLGVLEAEVVLASDGVEALERFEEAEFDIVIVDIEMPRLSGLDVIRTIRGRSDARARTPIVALTAYALREHRERIAKAGANGLISKPITSIEALAQGLVAHVSPRPAPAATPPLAVAETDTPDRLPVVDTAVYDALATTFGPEMMAELLEKVAADLTTARDDLAAAQDVMDVNAVRAASHIVVGVAGAVGASSLQRCARHLNTAAHAGDDAATRDLIPPCIEQIDAAVAFTVAERAER